MMLNMDASLSLRVGPDLLLHKNQDKGGKQNGAQGVPIHRVWGRTI